MRVFLLDNYDSFTWNLAQYLQELGSEVDVARNDAVSPSAVAGASYDAVVISPGPGRPEEAGITLELIRALAGSTPLLGVCLGHQAIGLLYGGRIVRARELMHGKTSPIHHDGRTIFAGLDEPFEATRYHSLVIEPESCPAVLEVSARTADGTIMGVRHREHLVEGVQFHPESILTRAGMALLANFLTLAAGARRSA